MVRARSAALIPVLMPSAASTLTVKAVPRRAVFRSTIGGRSSCLMRSGDSATQITPLQCLRMKATCSGVQCCAATVISPSFSRSSSSTTMTICPRRRSLTASSIVAKGG